MKSEKRDDSTEQPIMGETVSLKEAGESFNGEPTSQTVEKENKVEKPLKDEIPVPRFWTILRHGSNLGRAEWQGKENLLESDRLTVAARYPGLSCISSEDRSQQMETSERMGTDYDTTRGFSTVPEGEIDKPLEIRVLMPNFHHRAKSANEVMAYYDQKFGAETTRQVLDLTDRVFWKLNQQHPVVPNGIVLDKLRDEEVDGRRVVTYVPKELIAVYAQEIVKAKR